MTRTQHLDNLKDQQIGKQNKEVGNNSIFSGHVNMTDPRERKNSGNSLRGSEILYLSDYNAKAGLVHLQYQIGGLDSNPEKEDTINVLGLHDSGCAKSIIKTSLFKRLMQYSENEIEIKPDEHFFIDQSLLCESHF